jgi:hypothetical protein
MTSDRRRGRGPVAALVAGAIGLGLLGCAPGAGPGGGRARVAVGPDPSPGTEVIVIAGGEQEPALVVERLMVPVVPGQNPATAVALGKVPGDVAVRVLAGATLSRSAVVPAGPGAAGASVVFELEAKAAGEALVEIIAEVYGLEWWATHELDEERGQLRSTAAVHNHSGRQFRQVRLRLLARRPDDKTRFFEQGEAPALDLGEGETQVPLGEQPIRVSRGVRVEVWTAAPEVANFDRSKGSALIFGRARDERRFVVPRGVVAGAVHIAGAAGDGPEASLSLTTVGPGGEAKVTGSELRGFVVRRERVSIDHARERFVETYRIAVANRSGEAREVVVVESLFRSPNSKVTETSLPAVVAGRTIEFRFRVEPGAETVITYSVATPTGP